MSTDQTAKNGRTQAGTFAPGNKAAAGRSSRSAELRRAFIDAVSLEDVQEIAAALVKSAKGGDIAAAKLLLDRIGKGNPAADESNRENTLRIAERIRAARQVSDAT